MRPVSALLLLFGLLGAAAFLLPGCHNDPPSTYEPILANEPDNFHLVLKEAGGIDTTVYYFWSMGGTTANIDQTSDYKGGSVGIIVDDNDRVVVYTTDLKATGSFVTNPGQPGYWRVRVTLDNYSGSFDFRLQRK